jgi:hypothetical protein
LQGGETTDHRRLERRRVKLDPLDNVTQGIPERFRGASEQIVGDTGKQSPHVLGAHVAQGARCNGRQATFRFIGIVWGRPPDRWG